MKKPNAQNPYKTIGNEIIDFKNNSSILNWKGKFNLNCARNPNLRNKVIQEIKNHISKDICGIYAIYKKDKCLYIGVGKPIWKRIKSHYDATQGREKSKRWSEFFINFNCELTIYWLEFGRKSVIGTKSRQLIEAILDETYKPLFTYPKTNIK